jgi:ABC-type xylose transport system substrate-binding protein
VYDAAAKPLPIRSAKATARNGAIVVSLTGSDSKGATVLRIINGRGQRIFTTILSDPKEISVPAKLMVKGVYFIELNNGVSRDSMRCIVE